MQTRSGVENSNKKTPGQLIRKYGSFAAKAGLGLTGMGAAATYHGAATFIVKNSDAAMWVAKLTSDGVATTVFTLGGADFALINAYFSSKSIDHLVRYIGKQKSLKAKVAKTGVIAGYVASQDIAQFIISSVTSSGHPIEILIAVAGKTPGALYAGVGLMESDLPRLFNRIEKMSRGVRFKIHDFFSPLTAEEQLSRRKLLHYEKQLNLFLSRIDGNWRFLESHAGTFPFDPTIDPLKLLFDDDIVAMPQTYAGNLARKLGGLIGTLITANFSAPLVFATFKTLARFIPSPTVQVLLTAYLLSSELFGNWSITKHGYESAFENLYNLLSGKPIQSLPLQMRPKTSGAMAALAVLFSALSYAMPDFLVIKEFGQATKALRAFRYGTDVSIASFHVIGLFHFYRLMLSKLSKSEREQALFKTESLVHTLNNMTPSEFIEFAEQHKDDEHLGIELFSEHGEPAPTLTTTTTTTTAVSAPTTSSGSWFGLWGSAPVQPYSTATVDELVDEFEEILVVQDDGAAASADDITVIGMTTDVSSKFKM